MYVDPIQMFTRECKRMLAVSRAMMDTYSEEQAWNWTHVKAGIWDR